MTFLLITMKFFEIGQQLMVWVLEDLCCRT